MFAFDSIVLARFPWTDLTGDKRRPALVVLCDNDRRSDLVICFITSVLRAEPDIVAITPSSDTGLKVPSVVRFDKIATLDRSVITGKLGDTPPLCLTTQQASFFGVFGFGQPQTAFPS